MTTRLILDEKGLSELDKLVIQRRMLYAADLKSIVEDLTPIGVTGDLAGSWEQSDDKTTSRVGNNMHYARWQEVGTEPFNAKLIIVVLSPYVQKQIIRAGGKLVRPQGVTAEGSGKDLFLAPIWAKDWGPKVQKGPPRDSWVKARWTKQADNYINSWRLWRKIAKKGITPKRMLHRAVEIMKGKEHLYKLKITESTKVEARV